MLVQHMLGHVQRTICSKVIQQGAAPVWWSFDAMKLLAGCMEGIQRGQDTSPIVSRSFCGNFLQDNLVIVVEK